MAIPRSAVEDHRTQAALAVAAVAAARRVESRGPVVVAQTVAAYQALAAQQAAAAVPATLAEQGLATTAAATMAAGSLAGTASNGVPMVEALGFVDDIARFVATQVADAGRTGRALSLLSHYSATGYTRMLNPPSCARCAILAGRWYRWSQAFDRHPLCDCIQVASGNEEMAQELGLIANPNDYFESLPREEQDRIFGKAGAESLRLGADMSQVVNARSGMSRAQVFGKDVLVTTSGTTRRGTFGRANAARGGKKSPVRLMPESIITIANGDRDEAIRLLKLYGYLLPN